MSEENLGYNPEFKVSETAGLAAGRDVKTEDTGKLINDPKQDPNNYSVDKKELQKVIKRYKKLTKYMKSPMYQIAKLSGKRTIIDDLMDEFQKNPTEL